MVNIFTHSEQMISDTITKFALYPTAILAGGVSILGATALGLWGIYKAYLIMAGFVDNPLMTFFKELLIKVAVISMAGSAAFYAESIYAPMVESQQSLATELAQGTTLSNSKSIFAGLENNLADIGLILEGFSAAPGSDEKTMVELKTEEQGELGFFTWAWYAMQDTAGSVSDTVTTAGNIMNNALYIIKLLIVAAGLIILGCAAFLVIIINKVFFMISLGMAPLFLFFLAFESTRGWFISWLNTTLGYCFSYPLIAFVLGVLMEVYNSLYTVTTALSWSITFVLFIGSVIFAVIVSRLGDLASAYFSAGNIADGTALAVGMAGRAMGRKAGGAASKTAGAGVNAGKYARDTYRKRGSSLSRG